MRCASETLTLATRAVPQRIRQSVLSRDRGPHEPGLARGVRVADGCSAPGGCTADSPIRYRERTDIDSAACEAVAWEFRVSPLRRPKPIAKTKDEHGLHGFNGSDG